MKFPESLSVIGKIQRTHALKGELNIQLDVDDDYLVVNPWIILMMEGIPTPFRVESIRPKSAQTSLIKLKGVNSEEEAKQLVNLEVYVATEFLNEFLDEDDEGAYAADFIGYKLMDDADNKIGDIIDVDLSTEANPLFLVKRTDSDTCMIPIADELIVSFNPEDKTIVMNIPTGLLEL